MDERKADETDGRTNGHHTRSMTNLSAARTIPLLRLQPYLGVRSLSLSLSPRWHAGEGSSHSLPSRVSWPTIVVILSGDIVGHISPGH